MEFEKAFKIYAPFDLYKSVDEEGEVYYHGVASSTSIDRDNERMSKDVLHKAAAQLSGQPVFFNHQHKELGVGKITKAWVDGELLRISMKPTKAAGRQDVIMQIEEGILKAFSIGGKSIKTEPAVDTNGHDYKIIKDADFYEVSVVGIPANPDAQILGRMAKLFKLEDGEDLNDIKKERYMSSSDDDPEAAKGDGGEIDEKKPVVPPKKTKQADGSLITDDEVRESAKREKTMETEKCNSEAAKEEEKKKDEVKKENGPQTPTGSSLEAGLLRAKAELDACLAGLKASSGPVSASTTSAAPMPEKPEEHKSTEPNLMKVLKDENEELKKKLDDFEVKAAKSKSLVVDEKPSEAVASSSAKADGNADFAKASKRY